ncbi:hypothetical protein K438DRAFT_1772364 [Mycena galopus ATCC 62051]|nr:hypothetical protein K438DRAFT_1772364 [Mycena galopus ATCC 62051]
MDPAQLGDMWITHYTPQYPPPSMSTPLGHNRMPRQFLFSPPVTPQAGRYTGFGFVETETPESGVTPYISQTQKRRRQNSTVNDENLPPSTPSNQPPKRARVDSARRSCRTDEEKMKNVLNSIKGQGWTLGEFLYRLFRSKDEDAPVSRSNQHAQMVSKFLRGDGDRTPSDILACWMKSPYGAISQDSPGFDEMYSTTIPYTSIRPVRPALTAFALQTVGAHLARGAESAVKSSSGLHVSRRSEDAMKQLSWSRLGSNTISDVGDILESHLAAACYLLDLIATRKPRRRDGIELPPRKSRPSSVVITHCLSDLLFCRSYRANLLPVARGILYFGASVPAEIMAYNSRIGTMPSYSTLYRTLDGLSVDEASATLNHGRDCTTTGVLLFDNVQNLARVRDLRIGRENHMNVGMSGLWIEAGKTIDVSVFDLNDKRRCIADNLRADLTVDQLLGFLDREDADTTGYLQWLEVLVRCIKPLHHFKDAVSGRYRATAKLTIPLEKAVVHPLAASGKKETIPSELKMASSIFLRRLGRGLPIIFPGNSSLVGMGCHGKKPHDMSLCTKKPHTAFAQPPYWGRTSGKNTNPASLGHSASKIGRAPPPNLKKIDFYPGSQLLYLVLDARMLDCWRLLLGTEDIFTHFDELAKMKRLPAFEDLVATARSLHRTYSTARARDHAIIDIGTSSLWAQTIPTGSKWVPVEIEESSLLQTKKKAGTRKAKPKPVPPPCKGDFVLAQAMDFLRDGLNSRKIAFAVAEGDVGRLYECIKAGSTHSNYMNYLLETIINLELESSAGLKEALLLCMLFNLVGLAGHFEEGDYIVEFFNRLLEAVSKHKNGPGENAAPAAALPRTAAPIPIYD